MGGGRYRGAGKRQMDRHTGTEQQIDNQRDREMGGGIEEGRDSGQT